MATAEFAGRARVRVTATARLRRWSGGAGRLAVVEVVSLYGLPRRWLVIETAPGGERVISRHRRRAAAWRAAERVLRALGRCGAQRAQVVGGDPE